MTDPMIRCEELTRRFRKVVALDSLHLEVPEGAIYALIGPNGAGKTTLIKLLMNILRPTAGTVQVMGIDARRLAGKHFERIGYVSENQQMPEGETVEGMLGYLRSFYPAWDRDFEQQLLRRFEVPARQKIRHLSRGMRMKAAFVSSLAYRPRLLVLDEPFSGLDPLVREELVETLIESAQETTILLSSHDLSEIENVASHVGFLREGKLLCSEEMQQLTGRFREVSLTLDSAAKLDGNLPDSWLNAQAADHAVRFVHSGYNGSLTEREVAERFPAAREIDFAPMNLRAIFVAMARSARDAGTAIFSCNCEKENRA